MCPMYLHKSVPGFPEAMVKHIIEVCVYLTEALLIPGPPVSEPPLRLSCSLCSYPLWGAAEIPGLPRPHSCPRNLFCPKLLPPPLLVLVSHLCPPTHSHAHMCSHTQSHSHVVLYICTDGCAHRPTDAQSHLLETMC